MTRKIIHRSPATPQSGYALLTVIFLATLMVFAVIAAAPKVTLEGQRQKELDMIWRGKQYARGVKLYYRKMGRFPTSLDDLTKPKIGSIRFLRQAYKDPMNKQDGSWRLIYVGPGGQLIGSTKPPRQNVLGLLQPGIGQTAVPGTGVGGLIGPGPGAAPGSGGTNSGFGSPPPGSNLPKGPGSAGMSQTGSGDTGSGGPGTGTQFSDASPLIGGNIIGVGSKVKHPSILIYDHAKDYWQFEFIWDPSKETMAGGQPGKGIGTPIGTPIGAPAGGAPGNGPINPPPGPPLTPQQPPN